MATDAICLPDLHLDALTPLGVRPHAPAALRTVGGAGEADGVIRTLPLPASAETASWTLPALSNDIWSAIIQGSFTVLAAAVGAAVVMHQVRSQGRQGREQAAVAESLRLRLRIYDDVTAVTSAIATTTAQVTMATYRVRSELHLATDESGPEMRFLAFSELVTAANLALANGIDIVDRWMILDSRLDVFKVAFNVAGEDLRDSFYRKLAHPLMLTLPMDLPNGVAHWVPPDASTKEAINEALELTRQAAELGSTFATDFQTEMQNLLLSELGKGEAPRRKPIDPRFFVVTLEDRDELIAAMEGDTLFGAAKRRAEADAMAVVTSRSKIEDGSSAARP